MFILKLCYSLRMKQIELSQDERKELKEAMNSKQVTGRGLKRR